LVICLFIVSVIVGLLMTRYLPIGYEFATQLSYPQPLGASAGLLNTFTQVSNLLLELGSR